MKKLQYITILRAIAILLVIMVHTAQLGNSASHIHPFVLSIIHSGARGVQLFYILSALTIFLSFSYKYQKEQTPIYNYVIRRFFRIAPLFYLAIGYYLWQNGLGARYWLGNAPSISNLDIASNFLFIHGVNPYWINSVVPGGWSVTIEIFFYIIAPYLFLKIKTQQQAFNFVIGTIVIRDIFFILFKNHSLISDTRLWNEYLYLYFPNQLPLFGLGILLYFLLFKDRAFKLSPKSLLVIFVFLSCELAANKEIFLPGIFLYGIGFCLLIWILQTYQPRVLFNTAVNYIGEISYTLYLTHFASIYILNRLKIFDLIYPSNQINALGCYALNYMLVLSLSIIISSFLHFTIEKPLQIAGKNFTKY